MGSSLKKVFGSLLAALFGLIFAKTTLPSFIFDPNSVNWLLQNRDPSQAFLGQVSFLSQPWHFPLGLNTLYNAPFGTSIVYTDSIPLWSFVLKLFGADPHLQYFGYYLLLCFALNGLLSFLVFFKLNRSLFDSLALSLFAILSPFLLWRFHEGTIHLTLLAHFTVWIAALLALPFKKRDEALSLKETLLWCGTFALGLSIHFYLFILQAFFFAIRLSVLSWKALLKNAPILSFIPISVLAITECVGYFAIPIQNTLTGGFGKFSMNVLSPISNYGFGLLSSFSPKNVDQQEGFVYIGLGLIALMIFTGIQKRAELKTETKELITESPLAIYVFSVWVTICFSMRLSVANFTLPTGITYLLYGLALAFLAKKLFKFRFISGFILAILIEVSLLGVSGLFRSSGRLSWILFDLILIAIAVLKPRVQWILLFFTLQFFDLKPLVNEIDSHFSSTQNTPASCEIDRSILAKTKQAKIAGLDLRYFPDCVYQLFLNQTPVGTLYTARDTVPTNEASAQALNELREHHPAQQTLYIFSSTEQLTEDNNKGKESGLISSNNIRWIYTP